MSSAISMVALISSIMVASALLLPMYFGNLNLMPPAFAQNSKGDVNSYYSLAVEAIERGMYQEAVGYLDRVLAIEPDNVDALLKKGEALSYLGRYEEELQNYDRVLAIEPDNVDALFNKGGALSDLQRYEEELQNYDRVLAIEPDNVDALFNKGGALLDLGKYEEAIEYFDRVLASEPDAVDALNNKGVALANLGKYEEAIEYFDRALTIDSNNSNTLFDDIIMLLNNKGGALLDLGKYEEAIEYLDRVLASEPNNVDALNNKGLALYHLGRSEEAIEYLDRALTIDSNNSNILTNKGAALLERAENEKTIVKEAIVKEAIDNLDEALKYYPNNTEALYNKGLASSIIGNETGAIYYYNKTLYTDPNNVNEVSAVSALNNQANALASLLKILEVVVYEGNRDAIVMTLIDYQLSTATLATENISSDDLITYDKMIELYNAALNITANDTIVLSNKAIVYYKLAEYGQVIETCEKVIEEDPNNVACMYYKGLALEKLDSSELTKMGLTESQAIEEANKSKLNAQQVDPTYGGELINKGPVSVVLRSAI